MEVELDSCLICTSQCQSSQKLMHENSGAVKRERIENGDAELITANQDDHPELISDEEHLTPFFVLQNIFKMPMETLEQLIYGECNRQDSHSQRYNGGHVLLCSHCAELARKFHETFEEISRFKMILSGVQAEFMDKIQRNKDVQCQGSSSVWKQRCRQVVFQCFSDDAPPNAEESGDFEEELHFGETMIKAEVVDQLNDDEDDGFANPAFPVTSYSSSAFHSTSTFDVDEGVNENLSGPAKKRQLSHPEVMPLLKNMTSGNKMLRKKLPCPNCPFQSERAKLIDAHAPLHEEGSHGVPCEDCGVFMAPEKLARHRAASHRLPRSIQKTKRKTKTAQPPPIFLQCAHCPYKTMYMSPFNYHQQVHEDDSGATPCNLCGIFMFPGIFGHHRRRCAPAVRKDLGSDKKLSARLECKKRIYASNRSYTSFKRGPVKRMQYGCKMCPYETLDHVRVQVHVELHEEGSQATACGECGWFLPSEQMETHRAVNHSSTKEPSRSGPPRTKLKCGECSFETSSTRTRQFEFHVKGHRREKIKCEDCGCHLSLRQLSCHRSKYCLARFNGSSRETGASVQGAIARSNLH